MQKHLHRKCNNHVPIQILPHDTNLKFLNAHRLGLGVTQCLDNQSTKDPLPNGRYLYSNIARQKPFLLV